MYTCPACGAEESEGAYRCSRCGADLTLLSLVDALYRHHLRAADRALQQGKLAQAFYWLYLAAFYRPHPRDVLLEDRWQEVRRRLAWARTSLENRARDLAEEWASWSLHWWEYGWPEAADWAAEEAVRIAPQQPFARMVRLLSGLRHRNEEFREEALKALREALPHRALRGLLDLLQNHGAGHRTTRR